MDEKQVPRTHLTTVYRTAGNDGRSSIVDNATVLRTWVNQESQLTYGPSFQIVECKDMHKLTHNPGMMHLISSYMDDQQTHSTRPLVLAPTRALVAMLNAEIQASEVSSGPRRACLELKREDNVLSKWYEGEPVLATENKYKPRNEDQKMPELLFARNTEGVINHVASNYIVVDYPNAQQIYVNHGNPREDECSLDDLKLKHGYARTINGAQGMENPVTFLWLPKHPYNTRRKLYTAITRARSKVVIFAPSRAYVHYVCSTGDQPRKTRLVNLVSELSRAPTKRPRPINTLPENAFRKQKA